MKKFQFNLDKVLDYKGQILDSLRNEHAIVLEKVRRQEEQLEQEQARYAQLNREFRQAEAEGITIAEAMRYESGLRYLEGVIQRETRVLQQLQEEAERKRKQVVQARQETASLEKLKEKKHAAYLKDVQKSEELFIDELVSAARVMESNAS